MIPYHWAVPSRPVDERGQRATAKTNVFPIKREVKHSSIPWYHTSSSTNGTEISQRIRLHTGMRTRTIAIFLLNWMHSWDRVHCIVSSTTIKVPRDQSFLKISHFYNIDFFTNACSFFLFYSAPWKINIRKYNRLSLNVPQGWTRRQLTNKERICGADNSGVAWNKPGKAFVWTETNFIRFRTLIRRQATTFGWG